MNNIVQNIQQELRPVFVQYRNEIVFAYCFGSVARNEQYSSGDIDLAFYINDVNQKNRLKIDLYTECSLVLKRNDIDIVILNGLENLILAHEIILDGSVIFDSNEIKRIDYELKIQHAAFDFKDQRKRIVGI